MKSLYFKDNDQKDNCKKCPVCGHSMLVTPITEVCLRDDCDFTRRHQTAYEFQKGFYK